MTIEQHAQTVTGAVEKRNSGAAAVVDEATGWFGAILPSHVDPRAFVGMAKAYLKKNPDLAQRADRDPGGFMVALSECARLGLAPGDTFHILPFKDKQGGSAFTPVVDYTGEIELIYRAGAVSSVKAEIVRQGDAFEFSPDMDKPVHRIDWFGADRGDMVGVYAYAVMKDGSTSRVVVMNRDEVMKVKAVSKTSGRSDSPWAMWEDRMWLKTAIHQLAKWVPTSAEYRREQLRAAVEADNLRTAPAEVHAEVIRQAADNPLHYDADEIAEGS